MLFASGLLKSSSVGEVRSESGNLRDLVEPRERRDLRDTGSLGGESGVADVGSGSLDFGGIEGREPDIVALERVSSSWSGGGGGSGG